MMNIIEFLKQTFALAIRPALAGLCLASLAGCVKLERESLPRQLYALNVATAPAPDRAVVPGSVLKVRSFQEMPRYHGREFIYRRSPVRYQTDYYNLFLAPPGALLAEQTGEWLAINSPFERVVAVSSWVRPTHLLEGTITLLEGDFRAAGAPAAVLGLAFTLIDQTDDSSAIVLQTHYEQAVPLADTAPAGLVEGWNKALEKILGDFGRDLATALKPGAEAPAPAPASPL